MNKLFYLFSTLIFLACNTAPSEQISQDQPGVAVIKGNITNPIQTKVVLMKGTDKFETNVVENKFEFNVNMKEPGYYKFQYSNIQSIVHLQPGDVLEMNMDTKNQSKGIVYSGIGAVKNNYLVKRLFNDRQMMGAQAKLMKLQPEEYFEAMAKSEKECIERLVNFPDLKDNYFKEVEQTELKYDIASKILYYPRYTAQLKSGVEIDESFYDFAKEKDINNPDNLRSENFQNFITQYTGVLTDFLLKEKPEIQNQDAGLTRAKYQTINQSFTNSEVQSFIKYQALKDQIRYFGINGMEDLLAEFEQSNKNPAYWEEIQSQYNRWTNLAKGKPAPSFIYEDINGKKHGLPDWKGKFVYVDVWATWCGPCRREIPYLEKLVESYHGNHKVLFVSISIDRDRKAWENMITKDEMKGLQLYASASASIQKDYKISGIPRFLLIDPEGKILNVHAPRPSSGRLQTILDELVRDWKS